MSHTVFLPPDIHRKVRRLLRQIDQAEAVSAQARAMLAELADTYGSTLVSRSAGVSKQAVAQWVQHWKAKRAS